MKRHSVLLEDGRWDHTYRQSWIGTFAMCQERARLERAEEMPRVETDSACLGTAVHAGIELVVDDVIAYGHDGALPLADAIDLAQSMISDFIVMDNFQFTKMTEGGMRDKAERMLGAWYKDVLPTLRPVTTELEFSVVLADTDQRIIRLNGTMDLEDERGLKDWKTAGRKYDKWEYERFKVQPTVYCAAYAIDRGLEQLPPFEYVVMLHNGDIQRFEVERDWGHVDWLRLQLHATSELIEADLRQWSLGDQGWWCSEKWCGAYRDCKGAALGA